MPRTSLIKKTESTPAWAEGLTEREFAFVSQYVVDLNGTAAAQRCGMGKTRLSATQMASTIKRKPHVAAAISAAIAERSGVTGARVLDELARIAFAKMPDFARVEGGSVIITDTKDLTEDQQAAISEVTETTNSEGGRTIRVRLHDKMAALDRLAKVLSLYREAETKVQVGVSVDISDARARLAAMIESGVRKEPMRFEEIQPPLKRIPDFAPRVPTIIDAE